MSLQRTILVCVVMLGLVMMFTAQAAENPTTTAIPVENLLKADGTLDLNKGYSGSLDPKGWRMVQSENGAPKFVKDESTPQQLNTLNQTFAGSGDENWDSGFAYPEVGVNQENGDATVINAIAVNGKDVYVGGYFNRAGNIAANNIAKWDGQNWLNLGKGTSGIVNSIVISGGDVYVGGGFVYAGDVAANNIAKWNGNVWSALGSGVDQWVLTLAVKGNDIYAGGLFGQAGGLKADHVAKWNGSQWSALGSGVNNQVLAIAFNGNDVLVGGYFTLAGGVNAKYIAKWNGTQWSAMGAGVGNYVHSIIPVHENNVYAYGSSYVANWNGNAWSVTGWETDGEIHAVGVFGDDLYVGGLFSTIKGVKAKNIAKWNGNGWSPLGDGVDNAVSTLAVANGGLLVGGWFQMAGGKLTRCVAKWDGTQWSVVGNIGGNGLSGTVTEIVSDHNNVYAIGWFYYAGNKRVDKVAQWDGNNWITLGNPFVDRDALPLCSAIYKNEFYVAGQPGLFPNTSDIWAIGKWNGKQWSHFGTHLSAEHISDLVVNGDYLYAVGAIDIQGTGYSGPVKWDGTNWMALGHMHAMPIHSIAVKGNDVYFGGSINEADGIPVNNIAKWDGTHWSALGSGVNNQVLKVFIFNNSVYAYQYVNGSQILWKWNGSNWVTPDLVTDGRIETVYNNGNDVFMGGTFSTFNGVAANNIVKWNANRRTWSALGSGIDGTVNSITMIGDDLYFGGAFSTAGGKPSNNFACWHGEKGTAPQITVEPFQGLVGQKFFYSPKVTGTPSPTLTLVSGPSGMQYDSQTGNILWTPGVNQNGSQQFILKAENSAGTVQKTFTIWVDAFTISSKQHNNNLTRLSVYNNGQIGAHGNPGGEGEAGFQFNGAHGLYEGDLVIGKSGSQVSGGLFTREFGTLSMVDSIPAYLNGFEQAFESRFVDGLARSPIGVTVVQHSNSKSTTPDRDYVIMDYWIKNTSGTDLTGIHAGLAMDWDVGDAYKNLGGYDADHKLTYMYESGGATNSNYYGVAALQQEVSGSSIWRKGSNDNADSVLFERMTHITNDYPAQSYDRRAMLSVGPYDIVAGDSIRCVFALLGGKDLEDLKANADTAAAIFAVKKEWSALLTLSSSTGDQVNLTFGGRAKGTDGYDAGLDFLSPPVSQNYYSSFVIDAFPNNLTSDIRGWEPPFDQVIVWNLAISNADGITTTIAWNPSDLPSQGSFTLTGAGTVNMRTVKTVTFSGNKNLTIQYRPSATTSTIYSFSKAGWYLVSLNVVPQDSSVQTLFPTAVGGKAYNWDPMTRSYVGSTKMTPGKGYWIAMPASANATVTGTSLKRYSNHFSAQGWYMIGSVSGSADFTNPNDTPDGTVMTPAFGWDSAIRAYAYTNTLVEKQGYWAAIIGACDLTVDGKAGVLDKSADQADWDDFYKQYGNHPPGPPNVDFNSSITGVLPNEYALSQNYPNPFNVETHFQYSLPDAADVRFIVFNIHGIKVYERNEGRQEPGVHTVTWNANECSSGLYLVEFKAGSFKKTQKCVLSK